MANPEQSVATTPSGAPGKASGQGDPTLQATLACIDRLAIEALETGTPAVAVVLADAAGSLRRIRDRSEPLQRPS